MFTCLEQKSVIGVSEELMVQAEVIYNLQQRS